MNLHKVFLQHEFAVDAADARLEPHDGLVGRHTQIDDSIVEADVLLDNGHFLAVLIFRLFGGGLIPLSLLIKHKTACIFDLERQVRCRLVNAPDLLHLKLDLLGATFDGPVWNNELCDDLDDGLVGDLTRVSDHALADRVTQVEHCLYGCRALSTDNEAHLLALFTSVVDSAPDANVLVLQRGIQILHIDVLLLETQFRVAL